MQDLDRRNPEPVVRSMLAVRVDLQITWNSQLDGRPRDREISTVVALDALLK